MIRAFFRVVEMDQLRCFYQKEIAGFMDCIVPVFAMNSRRNINDCRFIID